MNCWAIKYNEELFTCDDDWKKVSLGIVTAYYSAKGVSSAPTLFGTEGKAKSRLKTHFGHVESARVVKVVLTEVEE